MNVGYLIVTLAVAVFGIIGNSLVIGAVLVHKRLRVLNNAFIINLAVADLLVAGVIHPFTALGITRGKEYFYHKDTDVSTGFCQFLSALCVISCTTSVFSIATVAINRYIYICHHQSYAKIYTRKTVPLMIVGMWLFGVTVDFPLFFEFGRHEFHTRAKTCIFSTTHFGYKMYFICLGILFPIGLIAYCYTRIVYFVVTANRRFRNRVGNETDTGTTVSGNTNNTTVRSADVKLLKTVATIGTLGVIIYTPLTITLLVDYGQVPKVAWMFSTGLMHSYSSINWCVYALTNNHFRAGYVMIFRKYICRRCMDQTVEDSGSVDTQVSVIKS